MHTSKSIKEQQISKNLNHQAKALMAIEQQIFKPMELKLMQQQK